MESDKKPQPYSGYPPNPAYPPNQGGYPPNQGGYPPSQGGYPPNQYNPGASSNVYVGQPPQPSTVIYMANRPYLNFTGAIVTSCIVFWFCGCLFGLIAFILAMVGQSSASNGDEASAKSYLTASYILSTIGLVVGLILIITLVALAVAGAFAVKASRDIPYNWASLTS